MNTPSLLDRATDTAEVALARLLADRAHIPCAFCGATGDVVNRAGYVGGQGYRHDWECRDRVACWRRIDARAAAS